VATFENPVVIARPSRTCLPSFRTLRTSQVELRDRPDPTRSSRGRSAWGLPTPSALGSESQRRMLGDHHLYPPRRLAIRGQLGRSRPGSCTPWTPPQRGPGSPTRWSWSSAVLAACSAGSPCPCPGGRGRQPWEAQGTVGGVACRGTWATTRRYRRSPAGSPGMCMTFWGVRRRSRDRPFGSTNPIAARGTLALNIVPRQNCRLLSPGGTTVACRLSGHPGGASSKAPAHRLGAFAVAQPQP
jgi:hypothetical protein